MNRFTLRLLGLFLASSMILVSCADEADVDENTSAAVEEDMTSQHAEIGQKWITAFNADDWETLRTLYTDNYVHHGMGQEMSLDESLEMLRQFKTAFNAQAEPVHSVSEGDLGAWHARITGTHDGAFMGMEPTGKPISITSMGFQRIEDGKIAEEWETVDIMGLMQQIGAMEAPASAEAPAGESADTSTGDTI